MAFNMASFWARSHDTEFAESDLGLLLAQLPAVGPSGPWLAGGALRRSLIGQGLDSDFDFFFRDADQLTAFTADLEALGLLKVRETEHHVQYKGYIAAVTRQVDIQCIRFKYYTDARDVIDSFDFTICQFAYDGENLECGEFSLWDLGRKRLAIHRITYPVATLRRVLKYTSQGFSACAGCLATILRETAQSPELLTQLDIQYVD